MAFLYETHLHTKEGSACGVSSGREYVQRYLDIGYTGIIVTDHFFRGNCKIDRNQSWKRWVNEFCRGYEIAREEGSRRGLDVFFGWEETIESEDYLIYGLDKEWLLEHPESSSWPLHKQFAEVKLNGGCVVHAHPYRYSRNIERGSVSSRYIDAVEAANSGNNQVSDVLALACARKIKITATAGSDIHCVRDIWPEIVFGVYLETKIETIAGYVNAIKNNSIADLKVPAGHFDLDAYY